MPRLPAPCVTHLGPGGARRQRGSTRSQGRWRQVTGRKSSSSGARPGGLWQAARMGRRHSRRERGGGHGVCVAGCRRATSAISWREVCVDICKRGPGGGRRQGRKRSGLASTGSGMHAVWPEGGCQARLVIWKKPPLTCDNAVRQPSIREGGGRRTFAHSMATPRHPRAPVSRAQVPGGSPNPVPSHFYGSCTVVKNSSARRAITTRLAWLPPARPPPGPPPAALS